MMKTQPIAVLLLSVTLLLPACATVQPACTSRPVPPAPVPLGESFQGQMQCFLQGSLQELTNCEQPLTPAKSEKR